ncbi:MAG: DUF4132 domain-containing protein [Planctomycetota bacterium]
MWSWISDFLGTRTAPADVGGLDPSAAKHLATALADLDQIASGLGRRAASFVMSGQDADVLGSLAATQGGGGVLRLAVVGTKSVGPLWSQWFAQALPSPAVAHRLALLFEAASRSEPRTLEMQTLGLPAWVEILLWEASSVRPNTYSSVDKVYLDHAQMEEMLVRGGLPADTILKASLSVRHGSITLGSSRLLALIPGLADAVARYPAVVRILLMSGEVKSRVALLEALRRHHCDPTPFAQQIADLLVADAKTVREAAEAWAGTSIADVLVALRTRACDGTLAQRALAIGFIVKRMSIGSADFLAERLVHENNANVKKVITDLQAQIRTTSASLTHAKVLPAIQVAEIRPLGTIGRAAITALVETWYKHQSAWWVAEERRIIAFNADDPRRCAKVPPKPMGFTQADIQHLLGLLEKTAVTLADLRSWERELNAFRTWNELLPVVHNLFSDPHVTPALVIRLAILVSPHRSAQNNRFACTWVSNCLNVYRKATRQSSGTRHIMLAADKLGLPSTDMAWELLDSYHGIRWPLDDLWEWYYEHPEIIAGALGQGDAQVARSSYIEPYRYTNALSLVEQFPEIPTNLQPLLWDLAFGGHGGKRGPAQRAVSRIPGMLPRVVSGLADGKHDVRLYAAEWLADLRDPAAIAPLEGALKHEKSEQVKAAMMTTLERLGVPIEQFLDRDGLTKIAIKGLQKGIPKDLAWLRQESLPMPNWSDGSGQLSQDVLMWWIVQAYKLKDPAPTPLLRRYAAMLASESAHALGERVLQAWIAEDTRPPTPEQVAEHVRTHGGSIMASAQAMAAYHNQQQAQTPGQPNTGPQLTAQQWYDRTIEQYRTTPVGTLIACKGVLAVAAAMGGSQLALLVSQFLKRWYGLRAAQCKALLQMLAATEHPTAIHVLLATATRFRTAGIRKEAEACVQELAQRRGWSVDELADRTIPAAGFDDDGQVVLSYGERSFSIRLQPDLNLVIHDTEGRTLTALPAPRSDDDPAAAEAAKKTFGEAKKQIKAIVKQQAERLYEAMCTSWRWHVADWQTYLLAHPLVGRLCRQVVWACATARSVKPLTFRALEDGTLTDVDDVAVVLPEDGWVTVAHPIQIGTDIGARWKQHLADYEVASLLSQFDRAPLLLPEVLSQEQRIVDRNGHLIEAFKLRGRATKLGWTRGQAEDGGWFHVYRKHFTAIGMTAVLEFTGNSLPEENRITALTGLTFERSSPDGSSESCVLADVPAPLLSECWNDVYEIAAQGTGFDPDWETKAAN